MSDQRPDQPDGPSGGSSDGPSDEEEVLAAMREEIDSVERHMLSRVEPGRRESTVIAAGVFGLAVALLLPWVGSYHGWELLAGEPQGAAGVGALPRLFVFSSIGVGAVLSAVTMAVRRWGLVWLCTVGCGFSVLHGLWAIWFRQSSAGPGPNVGMVIAMLCMVVITVQWLRVALARP